MNVSQALKKKARLLKEITDKWNIIHKHNSIIVGNARKFNIKEELEGVEKLMLELVELKEKIHKANQPVYSKIFLMSELKSYLKSVNSINTTEGAEKDRYSTGTPTQYQVDVDEIFKNELIKNLNDKIDSLQDELDYHNATAKID
jgi:hypothetical protein